MQNPPVICSRRRRKAEASRRLQNCLICRQLRKSPQFRNYYGTMETTVKLQRDNIESILGYKAGFRAQVRKLLER